MSARDPANAARCAAYRARNIDRERARYREYYERTKAKQQTKNRTYWEAHAAHMAKTHAAWRIRRWAYTLVRNARASSKTRGMPAPTIDESHVLSLFEKQEGRCALTGITMQPTAAARSLFRPSLDRIERRAGYEPGNVVLVSWGANAARQDRTIEEFYEWLAAVQEAGKR